MPYILVHPFGIWTFYDLPDAYEFLDELEEYDLNEIGMLKSRAWLRHPAM